ncbi:MAG: hypothetical protein AAF682_12170 [Planctomycetota bacterium]
MISLLLALAGALVLPAPAAPPVPPIPALPLAAGDPAADLRAAVLLPTPAERRRAARELAARDDVTLERWLELCRSFGTFDPPPPGESSTTVELWTGAEPIATERTEIFVYVPPTYDPAQPAPLLLQLHYTSGSGAGGHRAWQAVADRMGMLVVSPSEPGANVGYTFTERERQATLSALRWARLRYNVDENRVFATGVSRGGHLAWDLALRHPDRFAGIAPMIGGPRIALDRGENNIRYLENVVPLAIRDLQGSGDDPVLVHNLRLCFERLAKWKAPDAELIEFPELGHSFQLDAVDWLAFWQSCERDATPERVVRTYARPGEGRAFWVEVLAAEDGVEETFTPRVNKTAWERLDRFERLRYVQKRADERTGRLEATRSPSRVKLKGDRVKRARVLFSEETLPAKRDALVQWNRKTIRKRVERETEVLLVEFVERFDRTFLPVFEVTVP